MADHLSAIDQHFNRVTRTIGQGSRDAAIAFNVATEDVRLLKNHVVEVISKAEELADFKNSQIKNLLSEVSELKAELQEKSKKVEKLEEEVKENKESKDMCDYHFWVCASLRTEWFKRNAAKRAREAEDEVLYEDDEEEDEVIRKEDEDDEEEDEVMKKKRKY